jgi:outer membrane lipoprotein-sorting protein
MKSILAALLILIPAAVGADTLDAILARMDRAAKEFQAVSTDYQQVDYTAALKDLSGPEKATLRIKRNKSAVSAILIFDGHSPHTVVIKGGKAYMYYPAAKQEQIYEIGKFGAMLDQYILLAFGTSGAELRKNFDVKLVGTETVDSKSASKIELRPKGGESKKIIAKIELWIPEGESSAIREKVTKDSDDYWLVSYSNINLKARVEDSVFDLKLPKDTKISYPQR